MFAVNITTANGIYPGPSFLTESDAIRWAKKQLDTETGVVRADVVEANAAEPVLTLAPRATRCTTCGREYVGSYGDHKDEWH